MCDWGFLSNHYKSGILTSVEDIEFRAGYCFLYFLIVYKTSFLGNILNEIDSFSLGLCLIKEYFIIITEFHYLFHLFLVYFIPDQRSLHLKLFFQLLPLGLFILFGRFLFRL